MEQYLQALKVRLDKGEITQELYEELVERFKEPEKEPAEIPPAPSLQERIDSIENTLLLLLFMQ